MTPEQFKENLTKFLLSAFSAEEFRRFVRYLSNGDFLEKLLPGQNDSAYKIISDGVKILWEHYAINNEFFKKLKIERPRREDGIKNLQFQWICLQ